MLAKWEKQKLKVQDDLFEEKRAFEVYWQNKKDHIEQDSLMVDEDLAKFRELVLNNRAILPKSLLTIIKLFSVEELASQSVIE